MIAQALPTLQTAVDALHARLTAGRIRAAGTTTGTGLTGPTTDLSADELAILEDVMGGRWSARMSEIWFRDDLQVAGASEDDWALESEIAYCAIRRGLNDDALRLTVERIMRAGPYRAKWDEPRGTVTWLAQDVANAIATVQKRLEKYKERYPDFPVDELAEEAPAAPADETPEQKIARLERLIEQKDRELAQTRTVVATQMAVIRRDGPILQAAVETVRRIGDVIALPSKQLVRFEDGSEVVVSARRLRLAGKGTGQ